MLNEGIAFIESYSVSVDAFLNNKLSSADLDLFGDIPVPESLKIINPLLSGQLELYRNIAMVLVTESSNNTPSKNYLELNKIRKEPFKKPVIIVAGGASFIEAAKTETGCFTLYTNYNPVRWQNQLTIENLIHTFL